ncbi:MAG: alpha/beta hydrolase [Bryobacteraceae bacterium]
MTLLSFVVGTLLMPGGPKPVSFPTSDGSVIYGDEYGTGDRTVVLAHGVRFNKESWKDQATQLASSGFRVIAIDFRGYGKSRGGPNARPGFDDLYMDVLGAVRYARETGAKTVAVVGGSMGGFASANAAVHSKPGEIDRLVLLANPAIEHPERIAVPTLFVTSEGDSLAPQVRDQYGKAPEPKELLLLPGSAHAQNIFATDQGARLMQNILRFVSATGTAAH